MVFQNYFQVLRVKKKNKKLILTCSACGKKSEKKANNKHEEKGVDMIIKYLDKNEWKIKKGTMVIQDPFPDDNFDPFTQLI